MTKKRHMAFLGICCLLAVYLCSGCGGIAGQDGVVSQVSSSGGEVSVTEASSEPEKPFTPPSYEELSRSLYTYMEPQGVFENCSPEQIRWHTPEDMMMTVYGYHRGYAVCAWLGADFELEMLERNLGGFIFQVDAHRPGKSELGVYLINAREVLPLEEAFEQDRIDIAHIYEILPKGGQAGRPEGAEPISYAELEQPNYHSLSQSLYDHMVEEGLYHGDIIYRDNMNLEMLCTQNGYTLVHWGELDYLTARSQLTYGAYTFTTPQMGGPGGGGLYMIKGDEVMHLEKAYETGVIDIAEIYRLVPKHFRYEEPGSTASEAA